MAFAVRVWGWGLAPLSGKLFRVWQSDITFTGSFWRPARSGQVGLCLISNLQGFSFATGVFYSFVTSMSVRWRATPSPHHTWATPVYSIWWVQEGTRNSCTFWNIPMTSCLTSWSSNYAAIFALSRPVSMSGVSLATSSLPWTDVESNASGFICFQIWTVLFVWELCFPKCSPPPYGSFPWLVPHQASRFSAYSCLLSFSKCKVDHGDAQSLLSLVYWSQPPLSQ